MPSEAWYGVLLGAGLVLVVLGGGTLTVSVIARVMPAASLLVALLTYTLQVVLMLVFYLAITGTPAVDRAVDSRWLGGTVILGALVWTTVQIVLHARSRIPAFDLVDRPSQDL